MSSRLEVGDVVIVNDQGDVGGDGGVPGGQGEGGAGGPDWEHAESEAESLQREAQQPGGGQGQSPQQHGVQPGEKNWLDITIECKIDSKRDFGLGLDLGLQPRTKAGQIKFN